MAGNDLGSLLGGLLGGGGQGAPSGGAGNPPGGLLDTLTESGLAEQKNSWIGTGENRPVTGAQIQQALPDETLKHVADEAGVTPDQAATQIAQSLPQVVDRLTPDGQLPSGSLEDLIRARNV